ncbi:ribosome recycling factor [Punctularia strigosozonata HHB-11173 SS5]|uniref:ribosome recycling factor n=1 Tax=Punctularia strigosozonata (strain HHB-11173) TaxID=741275 RepID=UPI0004416DD9|nr:ribosome recycling factor [Punctularia strigosozonata HHB-11173 SS5]EIN08786.1 ribosome recycling factor [Punctularia strigosozonata HHB-11173 SS5]
MRSTASLIPASQKAVSDAAQAEYDKCKERMDAAIQWFRKECATLEGRATGRVTPALLAPIRVKIPGVGEGLKMEEVATVGVKDGSMLVVTLFEEGSYKHVEDAILSARLPGITPQKYDTRTIRIPIPKPTVEARAALYTTAATQAEDVRNQIRKHRITAVKHGEYDKHSEEFEAFQKLADKSIEEVDKILANLKKVTSPK